MDTFSGGASMLDHRSIIAAPCPVIYVRASTCIIVKRECKRFFEKNLMLASAIQRWSCMENYVDFSHTRDPEASI